MTLQSLDTKLLLFFNQSIANFWFDVLMPVLSYQGYLLVAPFLIYVIIQGSSRVPVVGKRHILEAVSAIAIACCAAYISTFAENYLKELIGRVRPCRAIEGIRLLTSCPKSFSMPSGHAISSFAFATPLFFLSRGLVRMNWRLYPLALAASIAFSRLYLGVHYPTDVLAGAILGAVIGGTMAGLYQLVIVKFVTREG